MDNVDVKQVADRAAQSAGQPVEVGEAVLNALVNLIHFELMRGNRVVMPDLIALSYGDTGALRAESLITDENGEVTPVEPVGNAVASAGPGAVGAVTTPTIIMPGVSPVVQAPVAVTAAVANRVLFIVARQDVSTEVVVDGLVAANHAVSTVEASEAALETVGQVKPDLVLIDGNITDFADIIREVKLSPGGGVVSAVTIYPEGADPNSVSGLRICDDEVVQEPYEVDDLVALTTAELTRIAEERNFFEQEIHFQFRTGEEWIEEGNDLIARLIDSAGIEEEKAASLSVAFREAVDNAARHGNRNQENRIIDVIYLLDRQKVTVTVEDEGDGFDTELYLTRGIQGNAVAAARERNQAGRVGGLGIMLMLKCLDDLEYNNVGNLVKLTKHR